MSNPYGSASGYPGSANAGNTPPQSPAAPQYGGGNYGSGPTPGSSGPGGPTGPGGPGNFGGGPGGPAGLGGLGGPTGPGGPYGGINRGSEEKNGLGLWAMILGIGGLILGFVSGIPAVILGFLGLKAVNEGKANNRGAALTGIITGAIFTVVSIVVGIIAILIIIGLVNASKEITEGIENAPTSGPNQTQGPNPGGGSEPTAPGGSGSNEGEGGSQGGGSQGGSSQGGSTDGVEVETNVKMSMAADMVRASSTAVPQSIANKEYLLIELTVDNQSDKDYDMPFPLISCEGVSSSCEMVTDSRTQKTSILELSKPIPAGESRTIQTGVVVDASEADSAVIVVRLGLDTYKFTSK